MPKNKDVFGKELPILNEEYILVIEVGEKGDNFNLLKKEVFAAFESETSDVKFDAEIDQIPDKMEFGGRKLEEIVVSRIERELSWIYTRLEKGTKAQIYAKVIDYDEREGSLEMLITIGVAMYKFIDNYGSLREGLDYIVDDIKRVLNPVSQHRPVRVSIKSYSRHRPRNRDPFLGNFLWKVSGGLLIYLNESYPDHNKYKNLGFAILSTGLFAFISAVFALSFLTDNRYVIFFIALLWGSTIMNIDMLMVNTVIKSEARPGKLLLGFAGRAALAIVIAFSVSVPIEMTLFKDEINDEIDRYDRNLVDAEVEKASQEFATHSLRKEAEELKLKFIEEMQGRGNSSGRRGFGAIAKQIKKLKDSVDHKIAIFETTRLQRLDTLRRTVFEEQMENNKYGFLASFRALQRLQLHESDKSVRTVSWGIKTLIFLVELLPILIKLFMRRGAYDAVYEYREAKIVRSNDNLRRRLP